jgi:RNA polymerase sigma factor (sigma-70 family)
MRPAKPTETPRLEELDDAALVERARQRDGGALWLIMKRHNQRLVRVARTVLGNDADAEDAVQDAYMNAIMHLSEFQGKARLSTWLTRIALNEALRRRRQRRQIVDIKTIEAMRPADFSVIIASFIVGEPDPEQATALSDIRHVLEQAIDGLPEPFRLVFVMRDVEEMTTEETALLLGLRPQTVKTRLHRARGLLRAGLQDTLATVFTDTFPFAADRCDRLAQSVLKRSGVSLLQTQSLAGSPQPRHMAR